MEVIGRVRQKSMRQLPASQPFCTIVERRYDTALGGSGGCDCNRNLAGIPAACGGPRSHRCPRGLFIVGAGFVVSLPIPGDMVGDPCSAGVINICEESGPSTSSPGKSANQLEANTRTSTNSCWMAEQVEHRHLF